MEPTYEFMPGVDDPLDDSPPESGLRPVAHAPQLAPGVGERSPAYDLAELLDEVLSQSGPLPPRPRITHDLPDEMRCWPIEPAHRPLPPKVPERSSDESHCDWVRRVAHVYARAYADVYREATGKRYWPFLRGALSTNKHYKQLIGAAARFVCEGVRPGRWVLWAFDQWRTGPGAGGGATVPPPSWVFSGALLDKLVWFRAEGDGYGARVDRLGPRGKALAVRWMAMRRAVATRRADEDGRRIAREWFPGDSWADEVAAAQAEVRAIQEDWNRRAAAGEWLWGS